MGLLYGRAGRLTAKNGGFRAGQCGICYGDGFSCMDCPASHGGAVVDVCEVCGGGIDDAGVCGGDGAVSDEGDGGGVAATQCSFLELMAMFRSESGGAAVSAALTAMIAACRVALDVIEASTTEGSMVVRASCDANLSCNLRMLLDNPDVAEFMEPCLEVASGTASCPPTGR